MQFKEQQRIGDATPAFQPIEHLGCEILSQPLAFQRFCSYVVEFPSECELSDANVHELRSLNRLPAQNDLYVGIRTKKLTDASLSHLLDISTCDTLDVTETSISDEGIEQLRQRFGDSVIRTRRYD